jgi:uncharacterized protein
MTPATTHRPILLFAQKASVGPVATGLLLSMVALLIAGTLKLWPLTSTVAP